MPKELLSWAGFADTAGLEVLASHEEGRQDRLVEFVFRGSPADIDRVLAAAQFTNAARPGIEDQGALPGFDLKALVNPRTARDEWKVPPSGQRAYRLYVRGGTPEGSELLYVWAFTT